MSPASLPPAFMSSPHLPSVLPHASAGSWRLPMKGYCTRMKKWRDMGSAYLTARQGGHASLQASSAPPACVGACVRARVCVLWSGHLMCMASLRRLHSSSSQQARHGMALGTSGCQLLWRTTRAHVNTHTRTHAHTHTHTHHTRTRMHVCLLACFSLESKRKPQSRRAGHTAAKVTRRTWSCEERRLHRSIQPRAAGGGVE